MAGIKTVISLSLSLPPHKGQEEGRTSVRIKTAMILNLPLFALKRGWGRTIARLKTVTQMNLSNLVAERLGRERADTLIKTVTTFNLPTQPRKGVIRDRTVWLIKTILPLNLLVLHQLDREGEGRTVPRVKTGNTLNLLRPLLEIEA